MKKLYIEMKKSYLGDKAGLVPKKYWSIFTCVGSASDWHYLFKKIVPKDKKRVLIVGVHGGRDYFYFKTEGYDVVGQDLFPDKDFGDVIVGNIENVKLPEKSFDVIVAAAVIEHVDNDRIALENIRKALKDDGIFVLNLPLYNDWEETHMHIYSRESVKRLVEAAGFSIRGTFAYPNLFLFPAFFNVLNHALNAVVFTLSGKTVYGYTLPPLWKAEYLLSHQNSWLFRALRSFMGAFNNGTFLTVFCGKSDVKNQAGFNKERFEPKDKRDNQR